MSALWIWLQFLLCLALIGLAGARLTLYGDAIADKTGLGGSWVGLILIATVTSLPELANGLSAVTLAQVPDIAVGDVLGSCMLNLLIVVVLDALLRGDAIYARAHLGHILSAGLGVTMLGLTGLYLLLGQRGLTIGLGHVGSFAPLMILFYAVAVRTLFAYEQRRMAEFTQAVPDRYPGMPLRAALTRYAVAAVVVVATGIWLPFVAAELARVMGWSESLVGTLLVALATSIPELVVAVAAVRLGAVDMAMGNLLGSNLFNILILAVDDLAYLPGPLLADADAVHALSAFSALVMTGLVISALLLRARRRVLGGVGWPSLALVAVYALNLYALRLNGA